MRRNGCCHARIWPLVLATAGTLALGSENASAAIPAAERDALVALYNDTNGAAWTNSTNWLGAAGTECTWHGVACNGAGTTVTGISLASHLLSGTLPAALGNLTNLTHLYLNTNQVTGAIPATLGNLTHLTHLYLAWNQLSGPLPVELGSLTSLAYLYLGGNQLSGTIPPELGSLTNLTYLYLTANQLSGTIPDELANLTNLTHFYLDHNQLSGTIPTALANLPSVNVLFLGNNQLSGTIPAALSSLSTLTHLNLSSNQLSGTIPAALGDLTNLTSLSLSANQLSGTIPTALADLTNLTSLSLFDNQLSGTIPTELGSLSSLTSLSLYGNELSGTIPAALASLTNLTYLDLFRNHLSGAIPPELGSLTGLTTLTLASNQLSGAIPVALGNLTNLTHLDLRLNALYSSDASLTAFLDSKQYLGDWQSTQTIAPTSLAVSPTSPTGVDLSWIPITYTGDTGGYRVLSSATSGGPYALATTTANKAAAGTTLGGLTPDTAYFFVVETLTNAHTYNPNTLISERTAEVSVTTPPFLLSIDSVTVTEGDSGTTTASFTVTLSAVSVQTVTVDYAATDDTATISGGDYAAASGTLTFAPGVTTQPLTVTVNGDTLDEPNEHFLVTLSNPVNGTIAPAQGLGTILDDDGLGGPGSAMPVELVHGLMQRHSLAALPGPTQEQHFFLLEQQPYSSYELAVDEVSGDLHGPPGGPLAVERLAADGTTVVQQSRAASPLGHSRSLRWESSSAAAITDQRIRIRSGGCTTDCGAEDEYRLRFYETTYAIPRFNNGGSQTTVLILQNPTAEVVNGTAYFWSASSTLVASPTFAVAPGATLILNTSTVSGAAGQSGALTIASDGPYGALSGKTVALEAATGFSFDSPMVARPR